MRLEGPLDVGTAQPGLEGRDAGLPVDVEQQVQPPQVDGDHTGERALPAASGPHAADDTRATTEGHGRDAAGAAHLEQPLHLPRIGRLDDGIRRLRPVAVPQPPQVGVALAPRMLDAPPAIGVHEAVTDDVTQRSQLRVARGRSARSTTSSSATGGDFGPRAMPSDPSIDHPAGAQGVRLGRVTPAVPHRASDRAGQLIHGAGPDTQPHGRTETQFAWATRSHMHRIGTV